MKCYSHVRIKRRLLGQMYCQSKNEIYLVENKFEIVFQCIHKCGICVPNSTTEVWMVDDVDVSNFVKIQLDQHVSSSDPLHQDLINGIMFESPLPDLFANRYLHLHLLDLYQSIHVNH